MKLSLKSKKEDLKIKKPGKISLSINKNKKKLPSNLLQNNEDDGDTPKITKISSFDQEEIKQQSEIKKQEKIIVINPPSIKQKTIKNNDSTPQQFGLIINKSSNENKISSSIETTSIGLGMKELSTINGEMPTQESYNKVPVEEFGTAFLRGLGWKGDKDNKVDKVMNVQRQEFLGIGAKEGPVKEEDKSRKSKDNYYSPVVMKDKSTGEIVDESKVLKNRKNL